MSVEIKKPQPDKCFDSWDFDKHREANTYYRSEVAVSK
jgi:hypothetical protein